MLPVEPSKENGNKQRRDIILSLAIAYAIRNYIFSGQKLNPKRGYFYVYPKVGEPIKIKVSTYYSWLQRGNVIPETGQTFKSFIKEVKADYRIEKKIKRSEKILDDTEKALEKMIKMKTKVPLRDSFGNEVVDDKTGRVIKLEDAKLLKIKADLGMFILERLDHIKYGKKLNNQKQYKEVLLSDLIKNE